ncbi:hypothetical protein L7F22_005242 [Adiantum nelumboides]|nr:hypothetical protein [Adiantum nelumboides]
MISLGYTRFQSDANVYSRHSTNVLLFLAIYVDDILILSNSQYAIDKAKGELQASFSMIDMGTLHYCLGIQLKDHTSGLELLRRLLEVTDAEGRFLKLNLDEQTHTLRAELWTESIGGLCENDFILAAKIDQVKAFELIKRTRFWA